ncbi:MAG: carboxypeptidase regulatory-like domain-containing protein [Pacificimonas sp.]
MRHISFLLAASALTVPAATIIAAPAAAQQITSSVEGTVADASGAIVPGATVVVRDERTGTQRTVTTGNQGRFQVGNLTTGGPYSVTATANGYQGQTISDLQLNLSGAQELSFELTSVSAEVTSDVIVITGARAAQTQLAVGPGQAFDQEILESFPSLSRDVRDIIRIDPRVSLERANEVDRVSCLGGNDRTNSFTVDGIAQADVFGLNGTPFASRNSLPIPFDAVRETAVEFAPFDVEYGSFTGCAINVVTKSGENDFHGSAFFTFRNEDLRGDTAGGESFVPAAFDEKRWGATFSGPIVKDRLFFFAAYEETDLGDSIDTGPAGGGFANDLDFVTQDQFDEFSEIVSSVYGRETGIAPRSTPESSVRYFGRVDAYLTDTQRLEATYQRLEETNVESDFGNDNFTGLNSFEDEGTISDYYSLRLYSDWTDNFSTEIRLSRSEVADQQGPVGGGEQQSDNPRPRLAVGVFGPDPDGDGPNEAPPGILSDGPGIFRSANQLDTTINQFKVAAHLDAGDHRFTLGGEINNLEVFNLFAINATGTLFFENLDDFREGLLSNGGGSTSAFTGARDIANGNVDGAVINATPTGDINEAAAEFTRDIYTFYGQDDWQVTDQLSLLVGARVDIFAGDAPRVNPLFQQRYGHTNAIPFSKLDPVFLPRATVTYDFDNEGFFYSSQVKGGVGIFSGGDPTVWFSNAFSNNGFSVGEGATTDDGCDDIERNDDGRIDVVVDGAFTGIPQCIVEFGSAEAAAGAADTQSTDPNIKTPTVVRANIGFSTRFGTGDGGFLDNWSLNLDYIYSRFRNPFNFVDLSQAPRSFTVDGRPVYEALDPLKDDCDATLLNNGGTPPVYANLTDSCFGTGRDDEIQLTNAGGYDSHVASFLLQKSWDRGIITEGGGVDFSFGYAYTDAEERRTNDNSTATSGFDRTAAFDRQNPAVRTSTYQSKHNITAALNLKEQFVEDFDTQLGFVFVARSGRPYSLTFLDGNVFADRSSGDDNALIYVPTGIDDPNIVAPVFDAAGALIDGSDPDAVSSLINYVNGTNCDFTAGQSIRANSCTNDWTFDLDMRLSQEIPGPGRLFGVNDKIELFADFDNFLNLLDGEWNESRSRGELVPLTSVDLDEEGRYEITNFSPDDDNDVRVSSSIWRIQLGVRYEF